MRNPSWRMIPLVLSVLGLTPGGLARQPAGWQFDRDVDRDALPQVPPAFEIRFFAREPLVRQPCAMAFDAQGRLCVGMGPQYRNPKPDTPGDSVVLVLDDDGDGRADRAPVFASGFNAIQGLAWHGRDLWVANAPDLTVVRDLDGDDVADEYVRVYTDLGNLEHGLHGLNWAPDGRLYMSKGNSKGLTEPGRVAPRAFRELWGVTAPPGTPDFPTPRTFHREQYRKAYQDPEDDWGREGGVLRCEDGGGNLEIVSRGMRNPWDIAFDGGFNWLGTDNDQTTGDRVFMPFPGAHFGWNHPWSAHWGVEAHAPSAPVSGPLFEGSGTGIAFGDSPAFPATHRGVFLINDWLRKTTFVWRPRWDGALLRPVGGWEPFVQGGQSLFRPTDLEIGPDGALWILGWGSGYGAEYRDGLMTSEGRVFRVASRVEKPLAWRKPRRSRPISEWTVADLVEDLEGPLPVWRINAQDELVRRGAKVQPELASRLERGVPNEAVETWLAWALGRMRTEAGGIDDWLAGRMTAESSSLNLRIQAIRILAHRARGRAGENRLTTAVAGCLSARESRLRMEAVQALGEARDRGSVPALLECLARESDPTVFYAGWQVLRRLESVGSLKGLLVDSRAGVRRAALLGLLETHSLEPGSVRTLSSDADPEVRAISALWMAKAGVGSPSPIVRGRPLNPTATSEGDPASDRARGVVGMVRARGGARYAAMPGGLRPGAHPYTDRGYEVKAVPASLLGMEFIQTANDDDGSRGPGWLKFEALAAVRVRVALDARAAVPRWIRDGFRRTGEVIRADHWSFDVFVREYPVGWVELGGNTDDGKAGGKGNYIVLVEALPLVAPPTPTTVEAALDSVSRADIRRGEWLFHAPGGAGCSRCHRIDGAGNVFGPDLANLGERASARHVVQSILAPNAVITEGFLLQTVTTSEVEVSGILLEESGLSLTLGLATGERRTIPKTSLLGRSTAAGSAMPAFDGVLTAEAVGDITGYLLQRRAGGRTGTDGIKAEVRTEGVEGFSVDAQADRLGIRFSGRPVGDFVFRDSRILRPYLANIHAPDGSRVTRNHPPVAGHDAVDHDTMHPGLWLAFGDVSGTDFWRNKGRIEHVRFVTEPRVVGGVLAFATESRLVAPDGRVVCQMETRLGFRDRTNAWWIEWESVLRSDQGDFSFGDQEEMGFGARLATSLTEKNGGRIRSSSGLQGAASTWGQPAAWCDYSGEMHGRRVGITVVPDSRNFRMSWWHNRDYGVFVANPFGRASMKQGERSTVTVRRGEAFRLKFGIIVHAGLSPDPAEWAGQVLEGR